MAEDSDLERTEPASAKRLQTARDDGNIPRSRELSTFAVTMTGVALLMTLGGKLGTSHHGDDETAADFRSAHRAASRTGHHPLQGSMFGMLWQLLPIFGGLAIVAVATPILIGGWNFTLARWNPS
jgi:flagellar biosynthetic protein FlhB